LALSGRERRNLKKLSWVVKGTLQREEQGDEPAQFTSELGEGRDLYACHSNDAVLARLLCISKLCLLPKKSHVMRREMHSYGAYQTW
jgi:hypothetical protein